MLKGLFLLIVLITGICVALVYFKITDTVTITSDLTYAGSIIISIEKIVGKLIIEMIGQILGMIAIK